MYVCMCIVYVHMWAISANSLPCVWLQNVRYLNCANRICTWPGRASRSSSQAQDKAQGTGLRAVLALMFGHVVACLSSVCVSVRGFLLTFVPRPCIFLFAFGSTQSHTHTDTHAHTHTYTYSRAGDAHAFCFIYLPFCLISNLAHNFVFCCILCWVRLTRYNQRYVCVCIVHSLSLCVCVWLGKRYLARLADCHFDPFGSGASQREFDSHGSWICILLAALLACPLPSTPFSLSLPVSISCCSACHKGKQAARKTKNNIACVLVQCGQAVCRQSTIDTVCFELPNR